MRSLVLLAALVGSTSIATAGDEPQPSATKVLPFPIAIAANAPFMWPDAASVGVSAYAAIHPKQSLRVNVASYEDGGKAEALAAIALGHSPDDYNPDSRITDISVGWQYFPDRVWRGLSIELGILRRAEALEGDNETSTRITTDVTGYAARGLIGWSWLGWKTVFVAVGVGASTGRYAGIKTTTDTKDASVHMTEHVSYFDVDFEGYLRFGLAFGL